MRNWKLSGKIGAIALTALGLALVPGDFNVPGVGAVEAFAAGNLTNLDGAEVTLQNASGGDEFVFKNNEFALGTDVQIKSIKSADNNDNVSAENLGKVKLTCTETIEDAGTYELGLAMVTVDDDTLSNLDKCEKIELVVDKADIGRNNFALTSASGTYPYTGKDITPKFSFTNDLVTSGGELVEETDYTCTIQEKKCMLSENIMYRFWGKETIKEVH